MSEMEYDRLPLPEPLDLTPKRKPMPPLEAEWYPHPPDPVTEYIFLVVIVAMLLAAVLAAIMAVCGGMA